MEERPVFVFLDTLPSVYECITCIINYSPQLGSIKQQTAIHAFSTAISELWCKAFTQEHVVTLTAIKKKLTKLLKDYRSQVQKKRGNFRTNRRLWRTKNNSLFDLLKPTSNPDTFDTDEKNFYLDQKSGARKMALSDQIDIEFEKVRDSRNEEAELLEQQFLAEQAAIFEEPQVEPPVEPMHCDSIDDATSPLHLSQSVNRSGLARKTTFQMYKCTLCIVQDA